MGKLIAKTAGATLALIIAALLLFIGLCSLCFPSVMVTLSDGLGLERAAAAYSVNLYEQTGEVADLADAVERKYSTAESAADYAETARLGETLLLSEGYPAFCAAQDETFSSEYYDDYDAFMTALVESARALGENAAGE